MRLQRSYPTGILELTEPCWVRTWEIGLRWIIAPGGSDAESPHVYAGLILASRADPPLPLARLRAQGQLTEVRAADLRFGTAEASAFLQTVMGLDLPAEAIATLESRTEGWIAGLQLAALSLQGQADPSAFLTVFTGSHRYVLDYLSDEVLARQPEAVQQFLVHTCILERLSAPLCDAVTEREYGQTARL